MLLVLLLNWNNYEQTYNSIHSRHSILSQQMDIVKLVSIIYHHIISNLQLLN